MGFVFKPNVWEEIGRFSNNGFGSWCILGVLYLCEVIILVYQLLNDVKVVCVGHILHGHIQSWCLHSLWGKETQTSIKHMEVCLWRFSAIQVMDDQQMVSSTDFVVFFGLLVELWRVVLSDGHDDVAVGWGLFELRDKLAGAVPQRHLPDKKKHPEKGETNALQLRRGKESHMR